MWLSELDERDPCCVALMSNYESLPSIHMGTYIYLATIMRKILERKMH